MRANTCHLRQHPSEGSHAGTETVVINVAGDFTVGQLKSITNFTGNLHAATRMANFELLQVGQGLAVACCLVFHLKTGDFAVFGLHGGISLVEKLRLFGRSINGLGADFPNRNRRHA